MSWHDATEQCMIRRGDFLRQADAGWRQPHVVVIARCERKMRPTPSGQSTGEPGRESACRKRAGPAPPVKYRENTGDRLCGGARKHRMRAGREFIACGTSELHCRTSPSIRKGQYISISGKIQAQNALNMLIGSRNVPAPTRTARPYVVLGPFWAGGKIVTPGLDPASMSFLPRPKT